MSTRITVDPVTRIEGHLRIDVEVDGGVVRKAWSSGQMSTFRQSTSMDGSAAPTGKAVSGMPMVTPSTPTDAAAAAVAAG